MPTPRILALHLTLAVTAVLLLATPAQAEEIFLLDNGEVLHGHVVREDDEAVTVRLLGFRGEARVDIPRTRIKRRFVSVDQTPRAPRGEKDWMADARHVELSTDGAANVESTQPLVMPAEEPPARDEGFFQRLARVAVLALPPDTAGRTIIGLLLFAVLLVVVVLGGRIAEIESLGLGRATALSALLGFILFVDIWFYEDALRADRAIWLLPVQGAVWLTAAMGLLRTGIARTILLFAFVLFSVWVVVFAAGSILISF